MFGPRQGARQWKQEAASRPALPLECCLAKTRRLPDGSAEGHTVEGRTVMDHSRIAGAVADVQPRSPEQRKKPRESHTGVQEPVLLCPTKDELVEYW